MVNYCLCHQYEFGRGAKYDFLGYWASLVLWTATCSTIYELHRAFKMINYK